MSKNRFLLNSSSNDLLGDTSLTFQHPNKETARRVARNSSYDGTNLEPTKDEIQLLKKKNIYLQNIINHLKDDKTLSPNISGLSNENIELKLQRDQYLEQLHKNEEMLWKAKEVISHLKSDLHLEALSKNLFTNKHSSGSLKPPRSENDIQSVSSGRVELKLKELTGKLKMKDEKIQELNQIISKLNLENRNLQINYAKALEKIKELKNATKSKGDISLIDCNQSHVSKADLQKKLDSTIQYNFELFNNYSKLLKENSDLQGKLFALEQETMRIRGEFQTKIANLSIIKEAENRVENLEQNLSRIEETSFIIPQIEQKFESLKRLHKGKIEAIKMGLHIFHDEISDVIQCITKNDRQFLADLNTSQTVPTNLSSTRGEYKRQTYSSFLSSIQNQEVKEILEQLYPSKLLKLLIQKLVKHVYDLALEKFHHKIARKLSSLEQKLLELEQVKVIQKSKNHPVQVRSKSVYVGRKPSASSSYGGINESNKENSFVNILNNSRF